MKSLRSPYVVDDLEHARVQTGILDAELFRDAAVVDEVVARLFLAAVLRKRDLRVREKAAIDVREAAEADRNPTGVVERVLRRLGEEHAREDLRDVLHVDERPHHPLG